MPESTEREQNLAAAYIDREPLPSDGPDFHAEHAAWRLRSEARTIRAAGEGTQ